MMHALWNVHYSVVDGDDVVPGPGQVLPGQLQVRKKGRARPRYEDRPARRASTGGERTLPAYAVRYPHLRSCYSTE